MWNCKCLCVPSDDENILTKLKSMPLQKEEERPKCKNIIKSFKAGAFKNNISLVKLKKNKTKKMKIIRLDEQYVDTVSKHLSDEFGEKYNYSKSLRLQLTNNSLVPRSFVMLDENNRFIGSVTLDKEDGHPEFPGPWISDLYIIQAYRKKGYASLLVKHVIQYASTKGFEEVYFWASTPELHALYKERGFKCINSTNVFKLVLRECNSGVAFSMKTELGRR